MMTIMCMIVTIMTKLPPPYKELLPAVVPRCPGQLGEPQSSIVILRYSSGTTKRMTLTK